MKRGEVPVRPTGVPGQIMIAVAMHRGLCERQPGRDRMPGIGRPHRLTAIPPSHGGDGHLQDIRNRYTPRVALKAKKFGKPAQEKVLLEP